MINGIRLKVCGLTSKVDAELAASCGADYLGFIFYPNSPRYISIETYRELKGVLSDKPRVAVTVEPTLETLRELKVEGFDFFQIHYRYDIPLTAVQAWSEEVGSQRLWLAPRIPPGGQIELGQLGLAGTVLFDTFQSGAYGGTGKTGDWQGFMRLQKDFPRINWILAGGLTPENITAALAATGARMVDVNSGVESVPGIKSADKLKRLCDALRATGKPA